MSTDASVFDPDSLINNDVQSKANSIRSGLVGGALNSAGLNPLNDLRELETAREEGIGALAKTVGKKGLKYAGNIILPGAGNIITSKKFWIIFAVAIVTFVGLIALASYKIAQDNTAKVFFSCGLDKECAAEKAVELAKEKANTNIEHRATATPEVSPK